MKWFPEENELYVRFPSEYQWVIFTIWNRFSLCTLSRLGIPSVVIVNLWFFDRYIKEAS